jgi:nitrite reductase/ring-hydroxylating ferredoxin subunit
MAVRELLNRVERFRGLDRVGDPLTRAVNAVIRGRLRDLMHGVWLGHPLHPAGVQLPYGAWIGAGILDAVPGTTRATNVLVGVGAGSALPAAVAGLTDWSSLPSEQRRVGLVHASTMGVAVLLYAGSLAARLTGHPANGKRLGYAGLGVASLGALVGGHLAYRQTAGVNQAAPQLRQLPPGWHDVCEYAALTEGKPLVSHIGDTGVLVSRVGDRVSAMIERCGHNTGPLGEGEFVRIDGADCVVCPWHGSTFRLEDGLVVHGPAATSQPMLRTRVVDGRVQAAVP